MRCSIEWLNTYLTKPVDATAAAEHLTAAGFSCESSERLESGDTVLEVETTSNRGDCLSHIGLAREIAAATGASVVMPPSTSPSGADPCERAVRVSNSDTARCPRYTARIIRGVRVGESPAWLQERLRAIGQTPRNTVVDCTNFLLFEWGQPTHVFDLSKLRGNAIEVRAARAGEQFLPLGEGARPIKLAGGELVIADAERPVALAGVKGGAETAVTEATVDLLIESAAFDAVAVRRSSRSTRLASDSSQRFERGIHPADVDAAAERLVHLILSTAGGTRLAGSVAAGAPLPTPKRIPLRITELRAVTGVDIAAEDAVRVLAALGLQPERRADTIECTVPPQRLDLTREIDLIEEVIRVIGLDRIPVDECVQIRPTRRQPQVQAIRAAKDCLAGIGFLETVTPTLIAERAAAPFFGGGESALRIADERAVAEPVLRPSILPSLLQVARTNRDRGQPSVRLFEIACAFWLGAERHEERRVLSLLLCGSEEPQQLLRELRGAVDAVVRTITGVHGSDVAPATGELAGWSLPAFAPAGAISIPGKSIGCIGLLSASVAAAAGLDGAVAAAEIDWNALACAFPPTPQVGALVNSPSIARDLSVVVEDAVPWAAIERVIRATDLPHLESLSFVGTWRGKKLGKGRKSTTLRLTFRDATRTLRKEEVDPHIARLLDALRTEVGGEVIA
ncbi:MAG: phenylalanine--tRNA ligase subunit beta [Phycisphaerae bacterium]|nr:phenylalanine--tRNA ligase subunit beta [Phycisphaerae bacterium]